MNEFAIHLHVVALAGLEAKVGALLPIDRDSPGLNQRIAPAPRTDAGGGEEAVQAHVEALKS